MHVLAANCNRIATAHASKVKSVTYLAVVEAFNWALIPASTSTYLNVYPFASSACLAFLQKGHQLDEKNAISFPLMIDSENKTKGKGYSNCRIGGLHRVCKFFTVHNATTIVS